MYLYAKNQENRTHSFFKRLHFEIQGDFFENNQKITTSVSGEKLLKTGKRTESISYCIHFVGSATHCLNFCEEKIDLRYCVTFLLGKLIKETLWF